MGGEDIVALIDRLDHYSRPLGSGFTDSVLPHGQPCIRDYYAPMPRRKPPKARTKKPAVKGGKAGAAKLSAARRKAIAKKERDKRWEGEWWIKGGHGQ
jgi:hypothetical protein